MGKVFNDQIIKILCAKNLNKTHNDVCEPNLSLRSPPPRLHRGESYVVFLDRQHRKDLQRQMGCIDLNTVTDRTLCSPNMYTGNRIQTWLNRNFNRQCNCTCSKYRRLKRSLAKSLHSIGKFFGLLQLKSKNVIVARPIISAQQIEGDEIITPALFGPFVDEPFCVVIDRFYYYLSLILGRELETERSDELERSSR